MADYFTTAAFVIEVDGHEAELLDEVIEIAEGLAEGIDTPAEADAVYAAASPQFRTLFPRGEAGDPFAGLLALFEDPSFPSPDSLIWHVPAAGKPGKHNVHVEGENVSVFCIARLLQKVCPSGLPFRFGWAHTSLPMRVDAFGGGYLEVRDDRIIRVWGPGDDPDAARLVVALKDDRCGLLFWNKDDGFGPLKEASVFSPSEADSTRLPITQGDKPGWLELPPARDLIPAAA